MNSEIRFSDATFKDLEKIFEVHRKAFKNDHFSSLFPDKMLKEYLQELIKPDNFCLIVKNNEQVLGYIIAGKNLDISIKIFIKRNRLKILNIIFSHPRFLVEKVIEILSGIIGAKIKSAYSTRLFLIAVSPDSPIKAVGTKLLKKFEDMLRTNEIFCYGLSVRKKNKKAIIFYERNGFIREFENRKSIFYYKNL